MTHFLAVNILQKIGWIALRPILRFFICWQIESEIDAKKITGPMIIAANHTSYLDAPILGTILSINSKIYPIFFITKDTIINAPIFGVFIQCLGAFAAKKGEGLEKSLEEPKKILEAGYSVVFFPQARRFSQFEIVQGRPGAAALALETDKPILPVAICGLAPFSWKNFFLRKYKAYIRLGQSFLLKEKLAQIQAGPKNLQKATEIIMEEIEKLMR